MKSRILKTYKDVNVLKAFKKLNEVKKSESFKSIISQKNAEKQIKLIM